MILGAGPAHAVHFGMYEAMKELAGGNAAGNQWLATCMFTFVLVPSSISFYSLRLESNFLAVCYSVGMCLLWRSHSTSRCIRHHC